MKRKLNEFATFRQESPVCPHCGFVHNAQEFSHFTHGDTAYCDSCGKPFGVWITRMYTTRKEE